MRRFWEKVHIAGENECWNYREQRGPRYPQFYYRGRQTGAHRVSWMLSHGEIPEGMSVCHECDNPRCVNPRHLYLDSHRSNIGDAARKGRMRGARGTEHPNAKLDEASVVSIRAEYRRGGVTQEELARRYGVARPIISRVVRRQIWKHV